MTGLPAKAFEEASRLPAKVQDQLGAQLLRDLEAEARWNRALARSPEALKNLAAEELREYRAGRTEEIGFDEL